MCEDDRHMGILNHIGHCAGQLGNQGGEPASGLPGRGFD